MSFSPFILKNYVTKLFISINDGGVRENDCKRQVRVDDAVELVDCVNAVFDLPR